MLIDSETKRCDECNSLYYRRHSEMASMCPECSHHLYGYDNCTHVMKNGRCKVCYWNGSQSKLIQSKKYEAIIEPNFSINIDGAIVVFEYLVLGFGCHI